LARIGSESVFKRLPVGGEYILSPVKEEENKYNPVSLDVELLTEGRYECGMKEERSELLLTLNLFLKLILNPASRVLEFWVWTWAPGDLHLHLGLKRCHGYKD
jgi:hypothetical protein